MNGAVPLRQQARAAEVPRGELAPAAAEAELLGCAIGIGAEPEAMLEAVDLVHLGPADLPTLGPLLPAVRALLERGEVLTINTVCAELDAQGTLEGVGGLVAVAGLSERIAYVDGVYSFAATLRRISLRRRLEVSAAAIGRQPGALDDAEGILAELRRLDSPGGGGGLVIDDIDGFMRLDVPPRDVLMEPWLRSRDLVMLYGWRGAGKSWIAMALAMGLASGGHVLRWHVEKPRNVLLVDGELPTDTLQARAAAIACGGASELVPRGALRIIAADRQERGIPSLATPEGRVLIEPHLDDIEVLILDNLASLAPGGQENEAESWRGMQGWLLSLRRRGVAVIFVHHAGKGGAQRGTSAREDVLDTVVALRRPEDYSPAEGARFEIHFEKARGVAGTDVEPFEATLTAGNRGGVTWTMRDLEDRLLEQIVELTTSGLSTRAVAREIGKNHSNVVRRLQEARRRGLL